MEFKKRLYFCPICEKYEIEESGLKGSFCEDCRSYMFQPSITLEEFEEIRSQGVVALDTFIQKEIRTYERRKQKEKEDEERKNIVRCPKCGSTNIQVVRKKWSPLTGVFTNKVQRVCVNCKHKF